MAKEFPLVFSWKVQKLLRLKIIYNLLLYKIIYKRSKYKIIRTKEKACGASAVCNKSLCWLACVCCVHVKNEWREKKKRRKKLVFNAKKTQNDLKL